MTTTIGAQPSRRVGNLLASQAPLLSFIQESTWAQRGSLPGANDFVVGNPHDMPLPGFAEALQRWSVPQDKNWFAYKMSEPSSQEIVAASLRQRLPDVPFEAADIHMTNGAFGGIIASLMALTDPGDEVIYNSPPWFFYDPIVSASGAVPIRVRVNLESFDLDLAAIEAAITERTRVVIVNSPNNPTGRIYPRDTLEQLAQLLETASRRHGRPIFILSDEAYCRIVYDGRECPSPTQVYPYTVLVYTYGKTLLTPGQRMGYLALPPTLPLQERRTLGQALLMGQAVSGYAFPNALLQHALPDIEPLSVDIGRLQWRRDRMVAALQASGYELHAPEGTFYLLPRSPIPDDVEFTEQLAQRNIFVLPGALVEMPGYFRISITANNEMVERAIPGFAAAVGEAR